LVLVHVWLCLQVVLSKAEEEAKYLDEGVQGVQTAVGVGELGAWDRSCLHIYSDTFCLYFIV